MMKTLAVIATIAGAALAGAALGHADEVSNARFECEHIYNGKYSRIPFAQDSTFRTVHLYNTIGYCVTNKVEGTFSGNWGGWGGAK